MITNRTRSRLEVLEDENKTLRQYLRSLGLEAPSEPYVTPPATTALGHRPTGPVVEARSVATDAALAALDAGD